MLIFLSQAKQRAEVLQSTHKFFSEQQQLKAPVSKPTRIEEAGKPTDNITLNHQGVPSDHVESDKPAPLTIKPIRTGPIKPQAIKPEESK